MSTVAAGVPSGVLAQPSVLHNRSPPPTTELLLDVPTPFLRLESDAMATTGEGLAQSEDCCHADATATLERKMTSCSGADFENGDEESSFWSWSLLFIWNSLLGAIALARCVLVGQLLATSVNKEFSPFSLAAAVNMDPATATCLACLALLACVAMAVHPEGLTWTAIRKIRELVMSFFHSSTTCWAWLLNDESGIISTVLALATFFALFFFCYVLHRTLAPKQQRRSRGQKSKSNSSSDVALGPTSATSFSTQSQSSQPTASQRKRKKKKNSAKKRNARPTSPSSTDGAASERREESSSPAQSSLAKTRPEPAPVEPTVIPPATLARREAESTAPPAPLTSPPKPERLRVESTSTVETAASSVFADDDTSNPHTPTSKHQRINRSRRSSNNSGPRATVHNKPVDLVVSSRWDALKPDAARPQQQQQRKQYQRQNVTHRRTNSTYQTPRTRSPKAASSREDSVAPPTQNTPSLQNLDNIGLTSPERPPQAPCEAPSKLPTAIVQPSLTPKPQKQVADMSFFSELNPRTPPFAPSTPPPPVLRAPPGLGLPHQQEPEQPQEALPNICDHSFFLPPAYRPFESAFLSAPAPPPGLLVPPATAGATVPSGNGSPLCFRPTGCDGLFSDNPFENEENEAQIEAELQELGGRMVGSVLDS